jgi:hypothetical protein
MSLPADEYRMRGDRNLDQRIALFRAANARHALPLQPHHQTIGSARWDRHIERVAIGKRDALFGAIHGLEKIDAEPVLRILPAHSETLTASRAAASSASEQIAEQIGEFADVLEAGARMVPRAFRSPGEVPIILLLRPLLPARIDLAAVVAAALLCVVQDRIGAEYVNFSSALSPS